MWLTWVTSHFHFFFTSLYSCLWDISSWMSLNRLRLNSDKTELLIIGSQFRPNLLYLMMVQNWAARLIMGGCKYDHITRLLRELHWLPVEHRITFKLLLMTFKALNNLVPCYIGNLLHLYTPNRTLRSSSKFLLQVPQFNLKNYGERAFSVCAPKLWNCLPNYIRCSPNVSAFKSTLKRYLFKRYFSSRVNVSFIILFSSIVKRFRTFV